MLIIDLLLTNTHNGVFIIFLCENVTIVACNENKRIDHKIGKTAKHHGSFTEKFNFVLKC